MEKWHTDLGYFNQIELPDSSSEMPHWPWVGSKRSGNQVLKRPALCVCLESVLAAVVFE